jgi:hypothetical protein
MKTILKVISFFVLVILMSSCTSNKNSLTETSILKHLSEKEIQHPIVFKTTLPKSYIKSVTDLSNGSNYYSQLYNAGYLTTQLRTDIPNPTASYRPYEVITTPTAEPYIIERKSNGSISLKTLEFNVVAVNDIRIVSDFKAEVDVLYKKNKNTILQC